MAERAQLPENPNSFKLPTVIRTNTAFEKLKYFLTSVKKCFRESFNPYMKRTTFILRKPVNEAVFFLIKHVGRVYVSKGIEMIFSPFKCIYFAKIKTKKMIKNNFINNNMY